MHAIAYIKCIDLKMHNITTFYRALFMDSCSHDFVNVLVETELITFNTARSCAELPVCLSAILELHFSEISV